MKTTKEDFAKFVKYCNFWVEKLGVKDWSIHYDHSATEGNYSVTYSSVSSRVATIVLGTEWDDLRKKTDTEINRLALHEVLHIVMRPLVAEAEDRFTTQSAIDIAEHAIIRKLEHIVVGIR